MKKTISVILATWFGVGFIPPLFTKGSASLYGPLLTFPFCYLLLTKTMLWNPLVRCACLIAVAVIIFSLGLLSISTASRTIAPWVRKHRPNRVADKIEHDQYEIVIDEAFGAIISWWPLTIFSFASLPIAMIMALITFHFFDGRKIFPASLFDKQHSSVSVMLDDMVAGLYASLVMVILALVIK
jgi:phosphatidylglycerophosphatase A